MGRQARIEFPRHHIFRMVEEGKELLLVRGGNLAYLGVANYETNRGLATFSGPKTLRKLAEKILEEIPA